MSNEAILRTTHTVVVTPRTTHTVVVTPRTTHTVIMDGFVSTALGEPGALDFSKPVNSMFLGVV